MRHFAHTKYSFNSHSRVLAFSFMQWRANRSKHPQAPCRLSRGNYNYHAEETSHECTRSYQHPMESKSIKHPSGPTQAFKRKLSLLCKDTLHECTGYQHVLSCNGEQIHKNIPQVPHRLSRDTAKRSCMHRKLPKYEYTGSYQRLLSCNGEQIHKNIPQVPHRLSRDNIFSCQCKEILHEYTGSYFMQWRAYCSAQLTKMY